MRICLVLLAVTMSTCVVCRAEDEKPAPATTKGLRATTAPSDADVEQQQAALTAARTFVQHVADGNDVDKAYALTSAAYRKDHSAEQFAEDAKALREATAETSAPGMQGCVSLNPKDGGSPVAMFKTSPKHTVHIAARGGGGRPMLQVIGVELARDEKDWRVTAFRAVDILSERGVFGRELRTNDKTARPVSSSLRGEVTAVEQGSFTVKIVEKLKFDTPSRTFAVDEKTQVTVAGIASERLGVGNRPIRSYTMNPGSLDDLKTGQPVTIEPSLDGKSALSVLVMPSEKSETVEDKKGL